MFTFRKVTSQSQFAHIVRFLSEDVRKHGGSASEVLDVHGEIRSLTVCASPWGLIVLNQPSSPIEALVEFMNAT